MMPSDFTAGTLAKSLPYTSQRVIATREACPEQSCTATVTFMQAYALRHSLVQFVCESVPAGYYAFGRPV